MKSMPPGAVSTKGFQEDAQNGARGEQILDRFVGARRNLGAELKSRRRFLRGAGVALAL